MLMMFLIVFFVLSVVCVLGFYGYRKYDMYKRGQRVDAYLSVEGMPVPQAISRLQQLGFTASAVPVVLEKMKNPDGTFVTVVRAQNKPNGVDILLEFDPKTNLVVEGTWD